MGGIEPYLVLVVTFLEEVQIAFDKRIINK
ncbi:MAG: hypothetical protein PWQ66_485 [Petrotoga sp.]|nr:hypothetical protein [Petrotoga sp.]